jgi:uncharacterized protein YqgV (UPF0045/DUF77 family)
MDISGLVTQEKTEAGEWFRVNIYGKNQDFELCILGEDSDAVQKYIRQQMKKIRINTVKKELNDEAIDTILESSNEGILVRIAGIRGLQFDKKHREVTGTKRIRLKPGGTIRI